MKQVAMVWFTFTLPHKSAKLPVVFGLRFHERVGNVHAHAQLGSVSNSPLTYSWPCVRRLHKRRHHIAQRAGLKRRSRHRRAIIISRTFQGSTAALHSSSMRVVWLRGLHATFHSPDTIPLRIMEFNVKSLQRWVIRCVHAGNTIDLWRVSLMLVAYGTMLVSDVWCMGHSAPARTWFITRVKSCKSAIHMHSASLLALEDDVADIRFGVLLAQGPRGAALLWPISAPHMHFLFCPTCTWVHGPKFDPHAAFITSTTHGLWPSLSKTYACVCVCGWWLV